MDSSKVILEKWRKIVDRYYQKYKLAQVEVLKEKKEIEKLSKEVSYAEQASQLVQQISQQVQQRVHGRISAVVSKCLSTVFDDPYEFQIRIDRKRGKTEARLVFVRDNLEIDPLESAGGGVVDVAAFALRLACVLCSLPPLRRVLILDEPFKHLHKESRLKVAQLLETLSIETGTQFILVTHFEEVEIGKVIHLS